MTELGELPGVVLSARQGSTALAINSQGQIVGGFGEHAYLWTPQTPNGTSGSMFDLVELQAEGDSAIATDINDLGQIVGISTPSSGMSPFLWNPTTPNGSTGTLVDLGDLPGGGIARSASGINQYGQVVGIAGSGTDAFLWTPTAANGVTGSMVELGNVPGGINAGSAEDVNSQGQVVGIGHARNRTSAFLWTPNTPSGATGSTVDLAASTGGLGNVAYGINSHGHVVGTNGGQAFLWTPTTPNGTTGIMQNLNSLVEPASAAGWLLVEAREINDVGQIVGSGRFDPDGLGGVDFVTRAFLLTPIPEPSAIDLVGIGTILTVGVRRRRS